ncbi:LysR family transcriptional regulator [Corallincola platygyrae]|uniref:LysR family transcriptional regulator n=1 Tax=Corallincola platygyrae TaxID=1193278 RepID=A0ABW4XHZ1_9GAMM
MQFDWNRARAFLVTAEEGSLSAAAKVLNMTQPTLSRQVAALEQELGISLFERVGRGLELTPSGEQLLEHVQAMGEAASALSLGARGRTQTLEGDICISATETMAAFVLPTVIQTLREKAPAVNIKIVASNMASDLRRREADIAIRGFRPTEPNLIAKKLGQIQVNFYATAEYLEKLGNPQKPELFHDADFIGFDQNAPYVERLNELGFRLTDANFPVTTENHLVHWQLAKQGIGIGAMEQTIGDAEPRVVRVLPDLVPFVGEIWLVVHDELRSNRRVSMVYELLANELKTTGFLKND